MTSKLLINRVIRSRNEYRNRKLSVCSVSNMLGSCARSAASRCWSQSELNANTRTWWKGISRSSSIRELINFQLCIKMKIQKASRLKYRSKNASSKPDFEFSRKKRCSKKVKLLTKNRRSKLMSSESASQCTFLILKTKDNSFPHKNTKKSKN